MASYIHLYEGGPSRVLQRRKCNARWVLRSQVNDIRDATQFYDFRDRPR